MKLVDPTNWRQKQMPVEFAEKRRQLQQALATTNGDRLRLLNRLQGLLEIWSCAARAAEHGRAAAPE